MRLYKQTLEEYCLLENVSKRVNNIFKNNEY